MLDLFNPYRISVITPIKLFNEVILGERAPEAEILLSRKELRQIINLAQSALEVYDLSGLTDNDIDEINESRHNEIFLTPHKCAEIKPKKQPKEDHLYIIVDATLGYIKVGRSLNPAARARNLRTASGNELYLAAEYTGCGHLEQEVHKALIAAGYHIRREWFTDTPEAEDIIHKICTDGTEN